MPIASADLPIFVELVTKENGTRYPESGERLAQQLIAADLSDAGLGEFAESTVKKTILGLYRGKTLVAFTVATEKRDQRVKFGPSAVIPRLRGKGYAGILRLEVENLFRRAGFQVAYSTCQRTNTAVRRYVEKAGYSIVASLPDHYRPGVEELVYAKRLAPIPACSPRVSVAGITAIHAAVVKRGGACKIECSFGGAGDDLLSIDEVEADLGTAGAFSGRRSYLHLPQSLPLQAMLQRLGYARESSGFGGITVYGSTFSHT